MCRRHLFQYSTYFSEFRDTFCFYAAKQSQVSLTTLMNSPFVLSRQRGYRACGEAGKSLRELVVEPHEEEVASEPGEGGEEGGGGLHQVHLRQRGHGGRRQRTQLLSVALCHPLNIYFDQI